MKHVTLRGSVLSESLASKYIRKHAICKQNDLIKQIYNAISNNQR